MTFFGKIAQRENKFKCTSMSLIEKMYINDIIIVHPKSVKRKHFVNILNAWSGRPGKKINYNGKKIVKNGGKIFQQDWLY